MKFTELKTNKTVKINNISSFANKRVSQQKTKSAYLITESENGKFENEKVKVLEDWRCDNTRILIYKSNW